MIPLTEAGLEEMLREMWSSGGRPEFIVLNAGTSEAIRVVSEAEQRLREVCTPIGLCRLFPSLRVPIGGGG